MPSGFHSAMLLFFLIVTIFHLKSVFFFNRFLKVDLLKVENRMVVTKAGDHSREKRK